MKKFTLVVASVLVAGSMFAQRNVGSNYSVSLQVPSQLKSVMAIDTLAAPSFGTPCDSLTLYGIVAPESGFMTGNNSYGDLEKAMCFKNAGTGTISGVIALTYAPTTTGSSTCKIYSVNATTKAPNTVLGTSAAVNNSSIDPNTGMAVYTFSTPVNYTNDFFASIVLPTGNDTLAIFSTYEGCYSNDSLAWEKWSNNSWWSFSNPGNWEANIDMAIFPIVDATAGISANTPENVLSIYPNPANTVIRIAAINEIQDVRVINAIGQVVRNIEVDGFTTNIDVNGLNNGSYYVQVRTNKGIVTKHINVIK